MIKAILFDFDGTLADTMGIWKITDHIFFARRNMNYEELNLSFAGMSMSEASSMIKNKFNFPESVEDIRKELIEITEDLYNKGVDLKPYAREFIVKAHENGYKLAVATSNAKELIIPLFERWDILNCFDFIITSCEVGRGKPSPDVFLICAKTLKVKNEECLVFEDTIEGVTAAKSAGMKVYCVKDDASLKDKDELIKLSDKYIDGFIHFFQKDDLINFQF